MKRLLVIVRALHKRTFVPQQLPEDNGIAGIVLDGFSFIGDEVPPQELPDSNTGRWYVDRDGYYYWGGGLLIIDETSSSLTAAPSGEIEAPAEEVEELAQTFGWFNDLGIEQVWNQFQEQGDAVTVAVLDTGYDIANEDLRAAVVGVNRFDLNPAPVISAIDSPVMQDQNGHGTFCASILASRNVKGIKLGLAPKCKLLIGKISDNGGLPPNGLETILNAIEWAVNAGAEIVSISFGKFPNEMPATPGYLEAQQDRFNQIIQGKKVLIFASSGDNPAGHVLTRERYPASFEGSISVGATNKKLISNVTVLSVKTIIHAQGDKVEAYGLGNKIEIKTGTSMSVPMVAAVAALAVSRLKKRNHGQWSPQTVLNQIYASGDAIVTTNKKSINPLSLFNQL